MDLSLPEGGEAAFKSITDLVIATATGMDLTTVVATPFGEMPAGHFLMIPMMDIEIHRWDLASATGQNSAIDSSIAEVCIGVLRAEALEGGRNMGASGPEVEVPAGSSAQDRLLGSLGRNP